MNVITMVAIGLALLACGAAAWLYRQLTVARAECLDLQRQMTEFADSQAQVIHTTKLASLGQMMAGVAHEMNTPLGFVRSNVEVVREMLNEHRDLTERTQNYLTDLLAVRDGNAFKAARENAVQLQKEYGDLKALNECDELLQDSYDGLTQLSSLVLNLKGFSRVDRDGMDSVNLNECVESALTIVNHELRDRIKVVKKLGELPKVKCVPSQINQVFLNLITNAAHAMDDGGTLTISTVRDGGRVLASFEDTGSGITEEVMNKMFDPFFTTKKVGEGTGLGLSIVHKIVRAHGGEIRVDSTVGEGTTFTIAMPVESD
jgi:two-component system, NtrC family, sensor kinase